MSVHQLNILHFAYIAYSYVIMTFTATNYDMPYRYVHTQHSAKYRNVPIKKSYILRMQWETAFRRHTKY